MLGHVGINVPDLDAARRYYGAVMPLVGFEIYVDADDEFAYRPMAGKPGAYLFFYPCAEQSQYSRHQTGLQHLAFVVRTRSAVNAVHSVVAELAAQFGGLCCTSAARMEPESARAGLNLMTRFPMLAL